MTKKQLEEKIQGLENTLNNQQKYIDELQNTLKQTRADKNVVSEKEFNRLLKDYENLKIQRDIHKEKADRLEETIENNTLKQENEKLKKK